MSVEDFRHALIPSDSPRLVSSRGLDPVEYSRPILASEKAGSLLGHWQSLYAQPFTGVTTDGEVLEDGFAIADEGFDVGSATAAAVALLDGVTEAERSAVRYPIDAHEWRDWYNPEFLINDHGIRLDGSGPQTRELVLALLRTCFSDEGFVKTSQVRSANLYLGELYDLRRIMNEWSYHFLLFGEPSTTQPWGWNLYGHHLTLNVFILGPQIVVSPTFMGAEPTVIDRGPNDRFELFAAEALTGLELMQSLPTELQQRAQTYQLMVDPAMPEGRWHFADERHLAGAYQDNRIIPYEGILARDMTPAQLAKLLGIVETFIDYLPNRPRAARMRQVEAALDETWWSWIGSYDGVSPFYYRVQSPVILTEFDNHAGVWLTNPDPARFHVHTVVRTPNGNDYGKDLLRQHYAGSHQDRPVESIHPQEHTHSDDVTDSSGVQQHSHEEGL